MDASKSSKPLAPSATALSARTRVDSLLAELDATGREAFLRSRWPVSELQAVLAMADQSREFAKELCKFVAPLVACDDELHNLMRRHLEIERETPSRPRRCVPPPRPDRYFGPLLVMYHVALKHGASEQQARRYAAQIVGAVKSDGTLKNDLSKARKMIPPEVLARYIGTTAFVRMPSSRPRSR